MRHDTQTAGIAIIGAGERGAYFIGSRLAEAAGETGLRVIGVQDRLPDRAAAAAAHLDALYARAGLDHRVLVFDGLDAAVTHPLVRLVLVTTHTDAHRLPVERAVAAGGASTSTSRSRCRWPMPRRSRRRKRVRPSDHDGLHPPLRAILDRGGEAGPVGADRQRRAWCCCGRSFPIRAICSCGIATRRARAGR
jgi:hypothetical protein